VLVSVNPYKTVRHLYDSDVIQKYRNVSFYELPPHMYVYVYVVTADRLSVELIVQLISTYL